MAKTKDITYITFLIAVLGAPFFAIYGQNYGYLPELHTTSYLIVLSSFWAAIFLWQLNASLKLYWSPQLNWFLAFYVYITISVFWAHNYYEFIFEWLQWTSAIILGAILLQYIDSFDKIKKLVLAIAISCAVTVWIGVIQYFGGFGFIHDGSPPSATFFNKNIANQFVILSFPTVILSLAFVKNEKAAKSKYLKLFLIATVCITLTYILFTGTRAATIAVFCQIIATAIIYFSKFNNNFNHTKIVKYFLLVVSIALVLQFFDKTGFNSNAIVENYIGSEQSTVDALLTDSGRLPLLINSLALLKDHFLLGVGLGNWQIHYPLVHDAFIADKKLTMFASPTNTHNDFIQYFTELGIIGISIFIFFLVGVIRVVVLNLNKGELNTKLIAAAILIFAIGFLVEANLSFPLQMPMPKILLVFWLIIAVKNNSINYGHNNETIIKFSIYPEISKFFAIALLLVTSLIFLWQQNWYYAEFANRKATADKKYGRPMRMIEHSIEAYEYNPIRYRLLYLAANGLLQQKQYHKALQYYQVILKGYPNKLAVLYQKAIANIYLKNYTLNTIFKHIFKKLYIGRSRFRKIFDYR